MPRVILMCRDYLGRGMLKRICQRLPEAIVSRVVSIEEEAFIPRFVESFPRKGSMVFICEDKESRTWLENIIILI